MVVLHKLRKLLSALFFTVLLVFTLLFSSDNTIRVPLHFGGWVFEERALSFWLILFFVCGALLGSIAFAGKRSKS